MGVYPKGPPDIVVFGLTGPSARITVNSLLRGRPNAPERPPRDPESARTRAIYRLRCRDRPSRRRPEAQQLPEVRTAGRHGSQRNPDEARHQRPRDHRPQRRRPRQRPRHQRERARQRDEDAAGRSQHAHRRLPPAERRPEAGLEGPQHRAPIHDPRRPPLRHRRVGHTRSRHHQRARQGRLRAEGPRVPQGLVRPGHQRGRQQVLPRPHGNPPTRALRPPDDRPRRRHHRRLGRQGRLLRDR